MNRRFRQIFSHELGRLLRRPMLWVLVVLLVVSAFAFSGGKVHISSGDASVGGTKAWVTSETTVAFLLTVLCSLFYLFFVAIAAGLSVVEDEEHKVGEILHATPLRPGEYVWGKFAAVTAAFLAVLALNMLAMVVCFHWLPNSHADEIRGPLQLMNYLRPALVFTVPLILFVAGVSFAVGERSRKPILVSLLPVAVMLVCIFFLWEWSPTWLSPAWNQVLMMLDPTGFRWLDESWIKLDRGVQIYNNAAIPLDAGLLLQRLGLVLVGLGAVLYSHRRFAARLRSADQTLSSSQVAAALAQPPVAVAPVNLLAQPAPAVSSRPLGFWRAAWEVARIELRELRSQPGLYIFAPLILVQTLGNAVFAVGAFGTPMLLTSGNLAMDSMNTLSLLLCLLLLFYTVESLQRERSTGLDAIVYATPVPTPSLLFGKALANSLMAATILLAALIGCALALLIQGLQIHAGVGFELLPFVLTWGLLLPTFLLWTSFITLVQALGRNRFLTYTVGLTALIVTGVCQRRGWMNWVGNWNLWSVERWSDLGTFELNREPLTLNRLFVLGLTALVTLLAVRLFNRQSWDAARILHRLQPPALVRSSYRLSAMALVPLVLGSVLYYQVQSGPGGSSAEKRAKDYWRKNLATWKDAPLPSLESVDMDMKLEPARSWFQVQGTYRLRNHRQEPLAQVPITAGFHWQDLKWTLDGADYTPEDRAGLYVFTPAAPLEPGQELAIGFSYHGKYPSGINKNGGGAREFILPSGVVLTSFGPSFAPQLGFTEEIGIDDDNRYEPREYPADYYRQVLEPAAGSGAPFTVRLKVTAPAEYTVNGVGTKLSEETEGDHRTVVWQSDYPVRFFNVVAGRWTLRRGEDTSIYYYPGHPYNVAAMGQALDAARRYYSEWFYPFPWQELKLSEFPNLASYAQGFATNITFSEGIGFLTRAEPKADAPFLVTAHEAAHQWWGNLLTPARGPGGDLLSEGMAHYSTLLLTEQVKGLQERIEFAKRIEERYGERRRVDSERPLVKIDGSRPGDTTVTYDKAGWVFWMVHQYLGREAMLAGLHDFIEQYRLGPDYPLLEDLLATLRQRAPDPAAFDAFVHPLFFEVVLPEYQLSDGRLRQEDGRYTATVHIENRGTARMPVQVAAIAGDRFDDTGNPNPAYHDARTTVELAAGESTDVSIDCDFEPKQVLVDPDALVLQLRRNRAVLTL